MESFPTPVLSTVGPLYCERSSKIPLEGMQARHGDQGTVRMADLEDGEVGLHVLLPLGLPKRHIWEAMQVCLLPQVLQLPGLHRQTILNHLILPEFPL